VTGVPSLPVYKSNNKFSCLQVQNVCEDEEIQEDFEVTPTNKVHDERADLIQQKKWESRFPRNYKIASTCSGLLHMKGQLQTTDTAEIR